MKPKHETMIIDDLFYVFVMRAVLVVALLVAVVSTPRPASAQVAPADSAAVLLGVASELESRGESDVAEALYRHMADRFPETSAAATARAQLDAATAERFQAGGETELKVWSALYGIWMGVAVPMALDADGSESYGLGLLVGGPAGFFAGRALASSRPVSLDRAWLPEHPARSPLRRSELLTYTHHTTSSALGAQKFPLAASSRISLSSVKSATARFRRPFSRSSSFTWRAWSTFIPPNSFRHR